MSDSATSLLWVDLEMTGINPDSQRIIEVAAIITDMELNTLGVYESIVHQPSEVLEAAEQWPKENMQELFEHVKKAEKNEETVQRELAEFIGAHFKNELAVLAGNSIHQDRRFIRRWWPEVELKLHYRMLDVSSYKIWIEATTGKEFNKSETHRALGDIEESIAEFKWSLEQLKQLD